MPEWLAGFAEHFQFNAQFFSGLWMIIVIDIILSGDNSVVIAMAVQSLPDEKRRKGIIIGTAAAVLMRIGFTLIATTLMTTPIIKIVGGAAILWIAVKLLSENEEKIERHKPAESIAHAVRLILIADASMSIDNVMAVAGAAHGNLVLLWFGLMLSIPLVVFASSILSNLMARFPWIVVLGALLLGKIGGEMIMTDHLLQEHVLPKDHHLLAKYIGETLGVVMVGLFAFYYWNRDRKVAPAQESEFHTEERGDGPT